ncbi:carboxypeptidase-like regulatory domain-containing protein [Actinomadura fibrosa]
MCFCLSSVAIQGQTLKGTLVEEISSQPVPDVLVSITGTTFQELTDEKGFFEFTADIPHGEYNLVFAKNNYSELRFPVTISGEDKDLGIIFLSRDLPHYQQSTSIISLSDQELDEEDGTYSNISGLLQASRDVFLNAAAFDFSPTFFRPRGYDSEYSVLMINGIKMNKFFNGRPLWSDWGGLNDVQRDQVFSMGITPSEATFGDLAGSTNIVMRASRYKEGGKISYAVANRAYTGRIMGSYHSGISEDGWAYSVSLARRFATESYIEGTVYDANSIFASVEKKINEEHSINFTAFYTPNRRGKNSPLTEEVYNLKGDRYNSYWGLQNNEIRNSRIKTVKEPVIVLNHFWKLSSATDINTNLAYQFGYVGDSRIDYGGSRLIEGENGEEIFVGGGSSPDPAYYQRLPSYFLRNENKPDYQSAYIAQKDFQENGQLDWAALYLANKTSTESGGNALYALYEDRNKDRQLFANTILRSRLTDHLEMNASLGFRSLKSDNFARVLDLLGGESFLDVDGFSEGTEAQNDLLHPNRLVSENDIFKYHYELSAYSVEGYAQLQGFFRKFDFYAAAEFSGAEYQREGFYQNGNFPNNSLGKSESQEFFNFGGKGGITYKITGKHLVRLNAAYFTKPPSLRNTFSNARQNNELVQSLKSEKIINLDLGYTFRSRFVKSRVTAFYGELNDLTEISFYYADGLSGLGRNATTAFVQEVMTGINKRHMGIEAGMEVRLLTTLKLKAAGSIGEYVYSNNPRLYLTSDDFTEARKFGPAYLQNYHLPGGPQQALQLGLEYQDPGYWWVSGSVNYFSNAFIDIAPLSRTRNFYLDSDGLPIVNYDPEVAWELLRQEDLGSYYLVNLVGGKSWRIKDNYLGFFASINNILGAAYRTGGYEQARNSNYKLLKADKERELPLFAPKYWYGPDTTYYAHVYYRF